LEQVNEKGVGAVGCEMVGCDIESHHAAHAHLLSENMQDDFHGQLHYTCSYPN